MLVLSLVTTDVPLRAMNAYDWLELAPGFQVRVMTADYQDGECNYELFHQKSGNAAFTRGSFEDLTPMMHRPYRYWDYIYTFNLVSLQGNPEWRGGVSGTGGSYGYGSGDGFRYGTSSGTWRNCTGDEVIRYTIAVKPRKVLIPLTLLDVSIGDF